jgi:hypothetical protein
MLRAPLLSLAIVLGLAVIIAADDGDSEPGLS